MSDLSHDVQHCFEKLTEENQAESVVGPIATFSMSADAVPGLPEMRAFNEERIKVALRRAYRYFAGVDFSAANNDECFDYTKEKLGALFSSLVIETFCDGIQIGRKNEHNVKMALFYSKLDELFRSEEFQAGSLTLALELTRDTDVMEFFTRYTIGSANALGHATGYAHGEGLQHKIWDLWMLAGTSMITAGYIAGQQLGVLWTERELVAEMEEDIQEGSDETSE